MATKTTWKHVGKWYDSLVGEEGHFYHKTIIIPKTLELLNLHENSSLIDIGCGQGVLSRHISAEVEYLGLDIASSLIYAAQKYARSKKQNFVQADLTKPWPVTRKYTHAACILALQNMEKPEAVFQELAKALQTNGKALFVLNHPCFRIPRQSSWGFHDASKTQVREIFTYMSSQKIPIVTSPGKDQKTTTWSFHFPLSYYVQQAHKNGFVMELLEEWCSPKESTGKASSWENRARKEFPLFMALLFRKT